MKISKRLSEVFNHRSTDNALSKEKGIKEKQHKQLIIKQHVPRNDHVCSSCSTSDTHQAALVNKRGKDGIVITTEGTYPYPV